MPLTGLKFKKEVDVLSDQLYRLFENIRVAYLSAKQDPKSYTKMWHKALSKLTSQYNDIDDLGRVLQQAITEKEIEHNEAKNPESAHARNIYDAIKELRYASKHIKDPFIKKYGDKTLETLLEDKVVFAMFIHWAMRSSENALSNDYWQEFTKDGDLITDGYKGLDITIKDIPSFVIEHYGDDKNTQSVKTKFDGALSLLKKVFTSLSDEDDWEHLVGIEISKAEKEDIDFLVPNKPMYRIFDVKDIEELQGFSGDWLVQEKYDGMRIQIHKIDNKIKMYSYNKKDITDNCKEIIEKLRPKKFGDCILDAELMMFNKDKPLRRAAVISKVFKKSKDEGELRAHVFDIMRHNDRDLTDVDLKERMQILHQNYAPHSHELLAFPSKKDSRIADSLTEIESYAKEIMKIPTSEGVVIKDLTSTYFKGTKKNPKWIKWKKFVDLDLIVLEKKSTKSKLFSYTLGAGPLLLEEARKLDSVKHDDRHYLNVGKALNTKVDVEIGSIVRVKVDEVKMNKKGEIRVFSAKVVEIPEVELPDKIITLKLLAGDSDSSSYKAKALEKSIIITDGIHGEAEVILKSDMNGFTIYGFNGDTLMTKNAIADLDVVKEEITTLMKEKKGFFRVGIKNFIQARDSQKATLKEIEEHIAKHSKLKKLYAEIWDNDSKKLSNYLKNNAEEILFEGNSTFTVDVDIIEKKYKTPEEYRKGQFKIYSRQDGNLSLTFLLGDEKIGWEIKIKEDDDIFDLFGKTKKFPAKVQETVSKEKLIDSGEVELGVQRHGYHEYILNGEKFQTKIHVRVVPLEGEKRWIIFSSKEQEPVDSDTDDGIWDIREDKNKDLSFEGLA